MKDNNKALILIILCTLTITLGQIFWKLGANELVLDFYLIITNIPLIIGTIMYGLSSVTLSLALKYGQLSTIHPVKSLSIIWVSIASVIYLGEMINFLKIIGLALILLGVFFIFRGDKE
jgi:uncharacterized membrane protein